jgi:hypothetical protein
MLVIALGLFRLLGTNYMLDALSPGPFANLFTAAAYIGTALWLACAIVPLIWYSGSLNDLKREALAAARLQQLTGNR